MPPPRLRITIGVRLAGLKAKTSPLSPIPLELELHLGSQRLRKHPDGVGPVVLAGGVLRP